MQVWSCEECDIREAHVVIYLGVFNTTDFALMDLSFPQSDEKADEKKFDASRNEAPLRH